MATSFNPYAQDDDELRAMEFARTLTPAEALMADERMFEQRAVRGVENLGRTALGLPASTEQNRPQAAEEIRALAQKVTPGTPEFYTQAADIFRKYGLVREAETMTQRLHDVEIGKGEGQIVMQLQRVRDQLQKRLDAGDQSAKPALAAIDRKLSTYGEGAAKPADPEFVRLMDAWSKETDPTRKEMLKKAVDAWIANKEKAGQSDLVQWARLLLSEKTEKRQQDKEDRKVEAENKAIISSLQATVRALDTDLQSAEALLVSPGLPYITGRLIGMGGRVSAAMSDAAADANALLRNVHAQTFIRALQDLKATSKTGASGLGQLTEKEGEKIQDAKAALDTQQSTAQFKEILRNYIAQLRSTRQTGVTELRGANAEIPTPPPPLKIRPSVKDLAPGAKSRPVPAPAPAPAAEQPKRKFTSRQVP